MGKGKKSDYLGKSLIRDKNSRRRNNKNKSNLHSEDLPDGYDWAKLNLNSVTEENSLEEFLAIAELANAEFTAEKLNAKVVSRIPNTNLLTANERNAINTAQKSYKHLLRIPRRPPWNETTSKEELLELEKENFLKWRRQLAQLQEIEHIILTPYERNIEFWRQLWRVIERSDIIVQIVDARNPLLFWCEDLEHYIKEVSPDKIPIILLNKSDFLTSSQRQTWAEYFKKTGQVAIFFSAIQENIKSEDSDCTKFNSNLSKEDDDDNFVSNESDTVSVEKLKISELKEKVDITKTEKKFEITTDILSREELLNFFKNLHFGPKVKNGMTTVGLVGYPNVGKSSTINALLHCKKVSVSVTPGKTKHFQTLLIDSELCLCDCPGLVFPNFVSTKAEMIINGILPIDVMTDPIPPVSLIVGLIPRHVLQTTFKIFLPSPSEDDDSNRSSTAVELLNAYGYMRGFITQRGLPDISRSARYILKSFVIGKPVYCHCPPGVNQSDYHKFPSAAVIHAPPMTPSQSRILNDGKKTVQDLDNEFFKKSTATVHIKSSHSAQDSKLTSVSEKPWKKHHNRNKKEKLRRVYNNLDQ